MDKIYTSLKKCKLIVGRKTATYNNLPEEIIHDIISKFSSELVLSYTRWRDYQVTSNGDDKITLYFVREILGNMVVKRTRIKVQLQNEQLKLFTSCNGLLLFTGSCARVVLNPITQEKITFNTLDSEKFLEFTLLGFYFHPETDEYRVLCSYKDTSYKHQVFVYSLKKKIWRNSQSNLDKLPRQKNPITVNRVLHWFYGTNQILTFDIDREEFGILNIPLLKWITLAVDDKERLCYCETKIGKTRGSIVEVSVLEDYKNQLWNKRYTIDLHGCREWRGPGTQVTVLMIHNEDDFVLTFGAHYYHYKLKANEWRTILKMDKVNYSVAHKSSLVSLNT